MPVLIALLLTALAASPAPTPAPAQAAPSEAAERESRKLYLRARTAVAEGQYREGLDLYRKVIEKMPSDAVVRYEYAQLLRDLGSLDVLGSGSQDISNLHLLPPILLIVVTACNLPRRSDSESKPSEADGCSWSSDDREA